MTAQDSEAKAKQLGFRQVTKDEFYATVGARDVIISIPGRWSEEIGYLHYWKTRSDITIGLSDNFEGGKIPGATACHRYWMR